MKYLLWVSTLSILLCASLAQAESKIVWEVSPVVLFNSGTTDYTISAPIWEVSEDLLDTALIGIRSKLEFPMDAPLAGFEVEIRDARPDKMSWTINLSAVINVTDPDEKMLDHDWFTYPDVGTEFKWSYTESPANMNYLLLNIEISKVVSRRPKYTLDVLVGLRYNRIVWEMIGFDGWQIHDGGERNYFFSNERALTYEATYTIPQAGLRMKLTPSKMSLLSLQATAGRLMASDLDDHLLRGKTAEASTTGWAFIGRAHGRLRLPQHGSVQPFISAQFEYSRQSASGSQTQTWYKNEPYNDPVTGEPKEILAGTSFTGIPYETSTRQMRFGVGFGLSF